MMEYATGYKTRVWKDRYRQQNWFVTYHYPYSGLLEVDYPTWQEAMDEAERVEKWREFL